MTKKQSDSDFLKAAKQKRQTHEQMVGRSPMGGDDHEEKKAIAFTISNFQSEKTKRPLIANEIEQIILQLKEL
ncbi:hypothetical protein ACDY97_30310 [Rhizobium mongolense]|uniref:hypothetical protein n=1 Tax=Rhizobium mongolense TaxID=57676 RepID=UPI003555E696